MMRVQQSVLCMALGLLAVSHQVHGTSSYVGLRSEHRATRDPVPDEDWDYVTVRDGAHMFWWLYGANQSAEAAGKGGRADNAPLVMWLQGGPGGSSTGFGNFLEIGPLDANLNPRNTTWVQAANVLFVDNPVGTGYSYVDDSSKFTTNNEQIAEDLLTMLNAFFQKHSVFVSSQTPFYVFSESYGGKMTTGLANTLLRAIDQGSFKANFKGVALGDSWIDGIDYVQTWTPFIYANSQIDSNQGKQLTKTANDCANAVNEGNWEEATNLWGETESQLEWFTDNLSFYNVLEHNTDDDEAAVARTLKTPSFSPKLGYTARSRIMKHLGNYHAQSLSQLMNGPIRKKLGIIPSSVTWGGQSSQVFSHLSTDFMKPVSTGNNSVDALLKDGRISVTIYNGQLDLICCTPGTEQWMSKLTWDGMKSFNTAKKTPVYAPTEGSNTGAFYKNYETLHFYYIMRAGHMVPKDNGPMALQMMKRVTGQAN
eukprot:gb/GECG01012276.1/.p1 GENE.gb/GECG01012276.1/~~gb/GECG01012276.1/.p1  ORF type:complete len:481 (+),score=49.98 gb/GECG01012276.1/:1-1443(+)